MFGKNTSLAWAKEVFKVCISGTFSYRRHLVY
ncbi:hypothetical protein P23_1286 [Acinetobacter calcoaceticus]|nr:hypothetical protein P23_1286 [Acinetobacter calcoaceticus]